MKQVYIIFTQCDDFLPLSSVSFFSVGADALVKLVVTSSVRGITANKTHEVIKPSEPAAQIERCQARMPSPAPLLPHTLFSGLN